MKKRSISILLILTIILGLFSGCGKRGGQELSLAKDGKSEYVIVRGDQATDTEIYAAEELQEYLMKISGVEIPIITDKKKKDKEIIVGKTNRERKKEFKRDKLGEEGFVIKTARSKLWLVGGGDRGTIYSVYAFLEDYLGCGFYTQTVEKVPEMKEIKVAIRADEQIPVFNMRGIRATGYMAEDISVKRHLNFAMAGRELSDKVGGGIYYCRGAAGHTFEEFIPPEEYFEEHPEYFSLDAKGNRIGKGGQLCLTNPDVLKLTIEAVKEWMEADPDAPIISVSQNDYPVPCLCKDCKKVYKQEGGAYSGAVIRFVNAVAKEIKKDYPDLIIATYAYSYTRSAPKKAKPADNVLINFATMGTCFGHLKESECEGDVSAVTYADGSSSTYLEDMKAWTKIGDLDKLWIRDYTSNFAYPPLTFPDFGLLRQNIKYYAESGATGLEHESGLDSSNIVQFSELRSYIISKLLWDPYMSEEEYEGYLNGFVETVYGPGGKFILEYLSLAEELAGCYDLVTEPMEMYPLTVVENHSQDELPQELTVEMVKNYAGRDWSQYFNWYKDVKENRITSEGTELFAKAVQLAETEKQRNEIEKISCQVGYLKSYYLFKKNQIGGRVNQMITKFIEAHPEEFTEAQKQELPLAISKLAREQAEKNYYDYNYELCRQFVASGVTSIRNSLDNWKEFDFLMPPSSWR